MPQTAIIAMPTQRAQTQMVVSHALATRGTPEMAPLATVCGFVFEILLLFMHLNVNMLSKPKCLTQFLNSVTSLLYSSTSLFQLLLMAHLVLP